MNPKVDDFLNKAKKWQEELEALRKIVLDCHLMEELKWRHPCYTYNSNNIVLIHGFKDYCALSFFKGALLQDTHNLLIQQTENVQSARQIRFTNSNEIIKLAPVLKTYIYEAVEVEKAGLKVDFKKTAQFKIPDELEKILNTTPTLKTAFLNLTPGRQRAYILYFSAAKQSKTRISRIKNYTSRILDGKGLNDCICGLSKKKPNCDGSHKLLKTGNKT